MTQPKMRVNEDGDKFWQLPNGRYHRDDGPAIEWASGSRFWFQNGLLHREDGPAAESGNGFLEWWLHGEKIDDYTPNFFGYLPPWSRAEALARVDSKPRPYSRALYLADIDRMFPKQSAWEIIARWFGFGRENNSHGALWND